MIDHSLKIKTSLIIDEIWRSLEEKNLLITQGEVIYWYNPIRYAIFDSIYDMLDKYTTEQLVTKLK
jgi:hypothetical protein